MKIRISGEKLYVFSYFIGLILIGAGALRVDGVWRGAAPLGFLDALFTSTSAVCVTGLVTVDTAQFSRLGQSIIATLIQLGGLGIVAFAAVYVAAPRSRLSLVNQNLIRDLSIDDVEHNPRKIVRNIVAFTFLIEALGALALYPGFRASGSGEPAFESVFHAVSAFCNAGFSTRSGGLKEFAGYPSVPIVIMALIVTGGIGFAVLSDLGRVARGRRRRLSYHSKAALLTTAALLAGGFAFFLAAESDGAYAGLDPAEKALAAAFQAVTPRTAGFDTVSQSALGGASVAFTILLMFIGASPGSTGGGVKTTTIFAALAAAFRTPDKDSSVAVGNRQLKAAPLLRAFSVIVKGLAIVAASWIALAVAEGSALREGSIGLDELLFEAVSAFGTVGLTLGITAKLGSAAKLALVLTMFAGRIGLFTMAMPRRRDSVERWADFPDASLMIG